MTNYPEHEKVKNIQPFSQSLHDFLEWLSYEKKMEIGEWGTGRYDDTLFPITQSQDDLLYEYFEIDKNKFFAEKEQMLEELRK